MMYNLAPIFLQKQLSLTAWIILAGIILFVLILNFSLFSALKKRYDAGSNVLRRLVNSINEPDQTDAKMRDELKERIERLRQSEDRPDETAER